VGGPNQQKNPKSGKEEDPKVRNRFKVTEQQTKCCWKEGEGCIGGGTVMLNLWECATEKRFEGLSRL